MPAVGVVPATAVVALCLMQCKTDFCRTNLQLHVSKKGYKGAVWLMGHTSADPTIDLAAVVQRKHKVRVCVCACECACVCVLGEGWLIGDEHGTV